MKKFIIALTVLFVTVISSGAYAQTLETTAYLSNSDIIIDGNAVSSCAYNIHGSNYFKLRDIAYMLRGSSKQFSVGWENIYVNPENTFEDFKMGYFVTLNSGEEYIPSGGELEKGNENKSTEFSAPNIALTVGESTKRATVVGYNIDDNNYFKLRDIAQMFDFNIEYDGQNVIIDTASCYAPDTSVLTRTSGEKIGRAFESDINMHINDMPMVSYYTDDDTGYSSEQLELLKNKPVLRGVYIDVRELRNYGFDVTEDNGRIDVERIPLELSAMADTEIINSAPSKVYELYSDSTEIYVFGNRTAGVRAGDMLLIPITALEKYIFVSSALYNSIDASMFGQEIYAEYCAEQEEKQYTQNDKEIIAAVNKMPYNWIDRFYEKPDINMIHFIGSTCNYTGYGDKEHLRNGKGSSVYGPAPVDREYGIYENNKLIEGIHTSPMQRRLGRRGSVRELSKNYRRDRVTLLKDNPKFRFNSRVLREGEINNDGEYCGKFKAYDENGELIFEGDYAEYEKTKYEAVKRKI